MSVEICIVCSRFEYFWPTLRIHNMRKFDSIHNNLIDSRCVHLKTLIVSEYESACVCVCVWVNCLIYLLHDLFLNVHKSTRLE